MQTNKSSILDLVNQQLSGGALTQMSQQLGTDSNTTSNAISMALPLLLNGLASNASRPEGAQALDMALGEHDGSVFDNISGLFGNPAASAGAGILGHILGGRRNPIEQGVGRATGLNGQQVGQLLIMLAPLIMGALGRMKKQQGIGTQQLPAVLNNERAEIERRAPAASGLGKIFDANNDGQIVDDIARLGSGVLGGIFGGRR